MKPIARDGKCNLFIKHFFINIFLNSRLVLGRAKNRKRNLAVVAKQFRESHKQIQVDCHLKTQVPIAAREVIINNEYQESGPGC